MAIFDREHEALCLPAVVDSSNKLLKVGKTIERANQSHDCIVAMLAEQMPIDPFMVEWDPIQTYPTSFRPYNNPFVSLPLV